MVYKLTLNQWSTTQLQPKLKMLIQCRMLCMHCMCGMIHDGVHVEFQFQQEIDIVHVEWAHTGWLHTYQSETATL